MRRSRYVGLGVLALLVAGFGVINCGGDDSDATGDPSNGDDGGIDSSSRGEDGATSDSSNPGDDAGGTHDSGGTHDGGDGGTLDGGSDGGAKLDPRWANWRMPNPVEAGLPNPASYTVSADVVGDNVTGLHWQRVVSSQSLAWQAGVDYCANLTLAGSSDWRLPTVIELYSLVDYTRSAPAIDVVTFPDTAADFFWTATPSAADPTQDFVLNFDTPYTNVKAGTTLAHVRCVR